MPRQLKKYKTKDPMILGKAINKTMFDKFIVLSNFMIAKFPITGAAELMNPVFKNPSNSYYAGHVLSKFTVILHNKETEYNNEN